MRPFAASGAEVAELVDARDLGSRGLGRGGSSPPFRIKGISAQAGCTAHRGFASARQGRTTNAMLKYRGGVLTPYGAATPLCPSGFASASLGGLAGVHRESATRQAARLDGTGPSASLGLLAVAHGYALASLRSAVSQARHGAPPSIWPRGARNAACPTCAELP